MGKGKNKALYVRVIPKFIFDDKEQEILEIKKRLEKIPGISLAFPIEPHFRGGYCLWIHFNKQDPEGTLERLYDLEIMPVF